MKLIKTQFMLLFLGTYLWAGDAYNYIDIEECILPISKKLEQRSKGNYDEINYVGSYIDDPIGISIEENDKAMMETASKAKKILHLDKKITIAGFEVFTDEKKTNSNKLVYLKDYVLLLGNYPLNDLKYMLEYCEKTSSFQK